MQRYGRNKHKQQVPDYRERVERRANTTLKSSLWSNYRLDGLSTGLRVLELLFPESLQTYFNVCLKNCDNRSFH